MQSSSSSGGGDDLEKQQQQQKDKAHQKQSESISESANESNHLTIVVCNGDSSREELVAQIPPKKEVSLSRNGSSHEQCRVCLQEKEEVLIELGCQCRGGLAKAHRSCIDAWFRTKGSNQCEICQVVAVNITPPETQPTTNYWVWRIDPSYRQEERERGCFSPLWVAFSILIGGLMLDVLISITLGVSALPVNIIIGVIVVLGFLQKLSHTFSAKFPEKALDQQMVRKEDVDFYCGFSRKELQSLCKKYNLPANRSSSDMAESLASFFEKHSLNSVGFGVPVNQDLSATTSRAPVIRTWNVKRDSYGNKLDIPREDYAQGAVAREPGFILGDNTPYQERNGNDGLVDSTSVPPYMRKLNEKGPTANSKRTDSRLENRMRDVDSGDSPSSSSFEFHVSLEEGISLSVDLNFNPSDWIKSMRDEVNVCDSMRRRKSPHSDLGINNATECKKQKISGQDTDVHVRRESSISPSVKDNAQLPSDHHPNGERSLASSAIEPCSRIKESSDTCKEKNGLNLSVPDSSGPGQIVSSCVESYSKSCCVNPVDLDCIIPPGKKLASESVMVAAEQNHSAGDLLVEIPENPSMESFQKVGNSSTVICPWGAGSELSSSEAEAYHSNQPCSPRKTSRSSTISSPEFIIDRESTNYSESFKFRCNGGKNILPPNTEEQEKSEVLSEQARSE